MACLNISDSLPLETYYLKQLQEKPEQLQLSEIFMQRYPYIGECQCTPFERARVPKFRKALEDSIMTSINNTNDLSKVLRIIDIGSGGAFQTIKIMQGLLDAGYRQMEFTLIDRCYESNYRRCIGEAGCPETPENVQSFVNDVFQPSYPDANIQLFFETDLVSSLTPEKLKELSPDLVLMIDLQSEVEEGSSLLKTCQDKLNGNLPLTTHVAFTDLKPRLRKPSENLVIGACFTTMHLRLWPHFFGKVFQGSREATDHTIFSYKSKVGEYVFNNECFYTNFRES